MAHGFVQDCFTKQHIDVCKVVRQGNFVRCNAACPHGRWRHIIESTMWFLMIVISNPFIDNKSQRTQGDDSMLCWIIVVFIKNITEGGAFEPVTEALINGAIKAFYLAFEPRCLARGINNFHAKCKTDFL